MLTIARIYEREITFGRAKELIAAFGIGLIARTVFQELSKLGSEPGWIHSAGIASATTVAIGYWAHSLVGIRRESDETELAEGGSRRDRLPEGPTEAWGSKNQREVLSVSAMARRWSPIPLI